MLILSAGMTQKKGVVNMPVSCCLVKDQNRAEKEERRAEHQRVRPLKFHFGKIGVIHFAVEKKKNMDFLQNTN